MSDIFNHSMWPSGEYLIGGEEEGEEEEDRKLCLIISRRSHCGSICLSEWQGEKHNPTDYIHVLPAAITQLTESGAKVKEGLLRDLSRSGHELLY